LLLNAESFGTTSMITAESIVLAADGFDADPEARRTHLGPGWEHAKDRGTPLNTGDMLRAALAIGAAPGGDWASCHSVAWDAWAEHNESDRELTSQLTRQSYPLGIVVNARGERFLDEGADFRNYTYAKYGAEILRQPDGLAFQLFDATTRPMLRVEEYDGPGASVVRAGTLDELAAGMRVDPHVLRRTVEAFNTSITRDVPLDAAVKDGRAARTTPPKSNWASPLKSTPFYAFPVTCGITFTYGGLRADQHGRALDEAGDAVRGLYVCGEMLGALLSGSYRVARG
jgi:tricarballylate dehydrogenase